uniref:uncharacterized protein LOC105349891 n=1 Tax=Fragaria vesca subsp. vesca TaxID=101020 RepID=UPI0005CA844C|nr:PREDICTED: uncharacterized protein LOC105349891 [Fragaria vesca subsp. vesca]
MAALMKFLYIALLICSLVMGGESESYRCTLSNLKVTQSATGKVVHGQPEWKVTITNDCQCTQLYIKISSPGFQTVEPIAPSILNKSGDGYSLHSGYPIYGFKDFSFTYAWATKFTFTPTNSQIACSV